MNAQAGVSPTEHTIVDQFSYWRRALEQKATFRQAAVTVFVGCGTSYNLAMSLAAYANASGRLALAVAGSEWCNRRSTYWSGAMSDVHVVALSRSGETTETVQAAKASRAAGAFVTGITVEADSSIVRNSDAVLLAATDPREGIVMTTSASLMLLMGMLALGCEMSAADFDAAERLLKSASSDIAALASERSHFVFLGGGALYGIAVEGGLKLAEMSQFPTQAFHPMEYRHGPISLVDEKTGVVMLHGGDQDEGEAALVRDLQDKGAYVVGLCGPGDVSHSADVPLALRGLVCLPVLQLLGQRAAEARNLDTSVPRHLTKVVMLA